MNHLVRVAEVKKTFSKGDTTNWSYEFCKIAEIIIDTIPSYKFDQLPKRYSKYLLKMSEVSLKENKDVVKALNLKKIKMALTIT